MNPSVSMACGNYDIKFDSFAATEETALNIEKYNRRFKSRDPSYRGINCGRQIVIMRQQHQEQGYVPLTTILQAVHCFDATEPRDFIFAIQAITQSADLLPDADYAKSVKDVFRIAVVSILCSGKYHDILALCGLGPRELGMQLSDVNLEPLELPSWVPDFRLNTQHEPIGYADIASWNAGGSNVGEVMISEDELRIQGYVMDRVSDIGPVIRSWNKDNVKEVLERAFKLASTRTNPRQLTVGEVPSESTVRTIARALLLGIFRNGHRIRSREDSSVQCSSEDFEDVLDDLRRLLDPSQADGKHVGKKFSEKLRLRSDNRMMFGGENGTIGLCKRMTELGDVVCVFPGCRFPFTVRPQSDQGDFYRSSTVTPLRGQLVGWCYVDGMMNGEGLDGGTKTDFILT